MSTLSRAEIVHLANDMRREYSSIGLKLTLRQLYYQFVARGLVSNGQKVYKRIGATLTEARYAGAFPPDGLEDRGRNVSSGDYTAYDMDAKAALDNAGAYTRMIPGWVINAARWWGQDTHVSVWVEKEALAGVFEPVCTELGVGWFACKGYPSVSALHQWIRQTDRAVEVGGYGGAVVLYFGDHDPDGWQIPRSAEDSIRRLRRLRAGGDYQIRFERVALNMDQIDEYDPPPFPAKMTSSRYEGYVDEHGTDSAWELDALEPSVLRQLIREEVEALFDPDIHAELVGDVAARRQQVRNGMSDPEWMAAVWDRR